MYPRPSFDGSMPSAIRKRDGPAVVGEHAMRALRDLAVVVGDSRLPLDPVHDHAESVGVEDGTDALEHAGGPLDAVARVDVRRRERHEHVAGLQVVGHEDEVVDLHDPVAVARPAVRVAAGVLLAAVVEDLGALPARPGLAGLPEVVLAEADDPLGAGSRRAATPRSRRCPPPARAAGRLRGRSPRAAPARAPAPG